MSTAMFRVLLVLAAVPLGLLVLDGQRGGGLVPAGLFGSATNKPAVEVLEAPEELVLNESGRVRLRVSAPASPGDTVYLETAGTYGLGYYRVDKAVLDQNREVTLTVPGRPFLGSYKYWGKIPSSGTYQEAKSATFAIDIVSAPAPARPTCGDSVPVKPDGSPWVCTYSDEFDGTELDRRFWVTQQTETSGFTTGTKTNYACALDSAETVAVTGGNLELSLVELPEVRACGQSKSSKFAFGQVMHFQTYSQTYGKYEVRAKIPDLETAGAQQSFWLWPKKNTYGNWPASGEIDFAEMYSRHRGLDRPYIHYYSSGSDSTTNKNITHADCQIRVGEYNTYGLEWRPRQLIVLLNDEVCLINNYSSAAAALQGRNSPFDKPFYLAMNQAMGTTGNEYDPDVMPPRVTTKIDYVRIWK